MPRFPSPAIFGSLFRGPGELLRSAATRAEAAFWKQRAQSAQRRKDWRSAVDLWRKAAETAPLDRSAATGCISALIYAGNLSEAADRVAAFVCQQPNDENGPVALARIAEARGDPAEAIRHWREALRINPAHRQALIRLGAALTSASQYRDAGTCADRLAALYPAEPHGSVLKAEIAQASEGHAAAASLWREAQQQFGKNLHFLRAYGRALLAAGAYRECEALAAELRRFGLYEALRLEGQVLAKRAPYQDHTEFWTAAAAQLPDNIDLMRKVLHAALWARRQADAKAAFERLLAHKALRISDSDYVVGLCLAELEQGGRAAARSLIRAFLRGMRGNPEYRAAALRLDRLILACFPHAVGAGVKISRSKDRFFRLIENARLSSGAAEPLQSVAALEDGLAQTGASCLFDTDIDPDSCRRFIQLVREHLAEGRPFVFVRLGDGEANAFQVTGSFASLYEADAAEREKVWWGRPLDPTLRTALAADARRAISAADALGFPTREWLLRDVRLDAGPPLSAGKSGRGLLTVLEMLRNQIENGNVSGKILTSAHLPQDLQRWNLYEEFFNGLGEVVLVSCHAGLPDLMLRRFGLRTVRHVMVPPGDTMREMELRVLDDSELPPQSTARALEELGDWPANRLVLVGAGYAGKIIIREAANRGGVALDLGSIFDHWMGAHTRSYQDLA